MSDKKEVSRVTIFMDSQGALRGIQSDEREPGQVLVLQTMKWESQISKNKSRWSTGGYPHIRELKDMKKWTNKQRKQHISIEDSIPRHKICCRF